MRLRCRSRSLLCRATAGVFVSLLLLTACHNSQPHTGSGAPAVTAGEADRVIHPSRPELTAEVAQFDDGGLGEFLDEHAEEPVYLNLSIPAVEFQGANDNSRFAFTVFDECSEDLSPTDKPNVSQCEGTLYSVPKPLNTRSLSRQQNGAWRLAGAFRAGKRVGFANHLWTVNLQPLEP